MTTTHQLVTSQKKILVLFSMLILVLVFDISLIRIQDFITSQALSEWRVIFFGLVVACGIIGQYSLLRFGKLKALENLNIQSLNLIHKLVSASQWLLMSLLGAIVLEVVFINKYDTILLIAVLIISSTCGGCIMGFLSFRFIAWTRTNFVVLTYGISAALVSLNIFLSMVLFVTVLFDRPTEIVPHGGTAFTTFIPWSINDIINSSFVITSVASFVAFWIATSLILRHYSSKFGRVKYWIIVTLPLLYFAAQFLSFIPNIVGSLFFSSTLFAILITLLFTYTKLAGGIFFGIAFLVTSRYVNNNAIKSYMMISSLGLILLPIATQSIVLSSAPYPPFGLVSVSFIGIASYFVLVGIYSCAISVANDTQLRLNIRRVALSELKMLDTIGTAQMEQIMEKKVMGLVHKYKDSWIKDAKLQTSLTDSEIRDYLKEVTIEFEKAKNKPID